MASFFFNDLNQPPVHRICQIVNSFSWNILRNHLNWPPKVVIGLILLTVLINFSLDNRTEVFNRVEVKWIRWQLHDSSSYKPLCLQPSPRVLWHMWGSVVLHKDQGLFPLLWLLFKHGNGGHLKTPNSSLNWSWPYLPLEMAQLVHRWQLQPKALHPLHPVGVEVSPVHLDLLPAILLTNNQAYPTLLYTR